MTALAPKVHPLCPCGLDVGSRAGGLCGACYKHGWEHGDFARPPGYITGCPACDDGGKVTTYQADDLGHARSYFCVSTRHPASAPRYFRR